MGTTLSTQKSARTTSTTSQRKPAAGPEGTAVAQNQTGMPDRLKSGVGSLSGISLEDVRVHANSSKPANLHALAYSQGQDVHFGSGEERHLPHEAWHVVLQKQGSVQQTAQRQTMQRQSVVQRYCDVPGCSDPKCNDPKNHKIDHFIRLRNVDIYSANRDKSDLGTGSDTNPKARDYVQDPNSFYPEEVSLTYSNEDSSYTGHSSYIQPPRTPDMKPDAGHIFGNQYGGSGKDTANIFAQEPKHNRGHKFEGEKTHESWRKTENGVRGGIQKGQTLKVTAKLHRKQRRKYVIDPNSVDDSDSEYIDSMQEKFFKRQDDDDRDKGGGLVK